MRTLVLILTLAFLPSVTEAQITVMPGGVGGSSGGSGGSGVPYTGATQDLDMGVHSVKAGSFQGASGTPMLIQGATQAQPAAPASGSLNCWFDINDLLLECQNSAGTVVGKLLTLGDGATNAIAGTNSRIVVAGKTPMATDTVLTDAQLPAKYKIITCQPGIGDGLNAIAAGTYLQTACLNEFGATWTITAIKCYSDNTGTTALSVTNGAGTALLTGAITCTPSFAAGTQSATTTIASGDVVKFSLVADGTSKQVTYVVTGTR